MSEISEAAKRLACELVNAEEGDDDFWKPKDVVSGGPLYALARVLQEHSDVAKVADYELGCCGYGKSEGGARSD